MAELISVNLYSYKASRIAGNGSSMLSDKSVVFSGPAFGLPGTPAPAPARNRLFLPYTPSNRSIKNRARMVGYA